MAGRILDLDKIKKNFVYGLNTKNTLIVKHIVRSQINISMMPKSVKNIGHLNYLATSNNLILDYGNMKSKFIAEPAPVAARDSLILIMNIVEHFINLPSTQEYVNRSLDQTCITWIYNFLVFGSSPQPKCYIKLLFNARPFLTFLLDELSILMARTERFNNASLWFYFAARKNIYNMIKYWKAGCEELYLVEDGKIPLSFAVNTGSRLLLEFVLNRSIVKTNQNHQYFSYTALHYAVSNDHTNFAQILLEQATPYVRKQIIDIPTAEPKSQTALHLACLNKNFDMVKILCHFGATFNVPDGIKSKRPLDYCTPGDACYSYLKMLDSALSQALDNKHKAFQNAENFDEFHELDGCNARDFKTKKSVFDLLFKNDSDI